ncbi:MAG: hypothetical protein EAY72_05780 [Bacteroidetes bacterium]|nr:MAG: hypothetical protein EAY72_05780 [Bacteroidota bacterium]
MSHTNTAFELAYQLVAYTHQNVFLTGKAGTGKTTFLKEIKAKLTKKLVVTAPTGVAAINAGGVTLHSFFQIPFGPFIPSTSDDADANTKATLFKKLRVTKNRIQLFQELELLVIDEVSMVRADTLDAIDAILQHFRRNYTPFGGVQVLFIGDLYQLPPVVTDAEKPLLQPYYASPYFFDSKVLQTAKPIYLELTTVYRQKDENFIQTLNKIRNNEMDVQAWQMLQQRFNAPIANQDTAVTLTALNSTAEALNSSRLAALPGKKHSYKGIFNGDYNDKALPAEADLQLKPGAQVMFVKNDVGEHRRYYNGMLAIVTQLTPESIHVETLQSGETIEVKKEVWKQIQYQLNTQTQQIEEEELGSYTQYPLKLAWAITIHKSQGLTFTEVVIDAGKSFASGQVYVALSRCTHLQGIQLKTMFTQAQVFTDERIVQFVQQAPPLHHIAEKLAGYKQLFEAQHLLQQFNFTKWIEHAKDAEADLQAKPLTGMEPLLQQYRQAQKQLAQTATQFRQQLENLLQNQQHAQVQDRLVKAIQYFVPIIQQQCLSPLLQFAQQIQAVKTVKMQQEALETLFITAQQTCRSLCHLQYQNTSFEYLEKQFQYSTWKWEKPKKVDSHFISFQLWEEGLTAVQIAQKRGMAASTIEGHLCHYVETGEIPIDAMVPAELQGPILTAMAQATEPGTNAVKALLPADVEYTAIRFMQAYVKHQKAKAEQTAPTETE